MSSHDCRARHDSSRKRHQQHRDGRTRTSALPHLDCLGTRLIDCFSGHCLSHDVRVPHFVVLADVLTRDGGRFAIDRLSGQLRACGWAVGNGVACGKRHIDSFIISLSLFFVVITISIGTANARLSTSFARFDGQAGTDCLAIGPAEGHPRLPSGCL